MNDKPEYLVIPGEKIKIRDKKLDDVQNDYKWFCDPELSRLDAAYPMKMSLSEYIDEYSAELRYPSPQRRRFSIETTTGEHIGNCSYYNIDTRRLETEIGIMIGDADYLNKGYGTDTINTLVKYIFENTNFNRLYLKTLEWNIRAQRCFMKCGFAIYNKIARNSYSFLLMELTREKWEQSRRATNRQAGDLRDTFR